MRSVRTTPDQKYYLNHTQKYMFRHRDLRRLRVEQFNRYFAMAGDKDANPMTLADTITDDDDSLLADAHHRHSDPIMEYVPREPTTSRRSNTSRGVVDARLQSYG